MPTNITYQDSADDEDCEVQVYIKDADGIPLVGETVVIFPDEDAEVGTPYVVTERFW